MSFALKVASILAVVAFVAAANAPQATYEPAFVQTFKKLHYGPRKPYYVNVYITPAWITQKLDHFDDSEDRTWQQRYMTNDKYYEEGGPIFIFVGGDWSISAASISSGLFVDLAKEHKGLIFYVEHRYYGESKPTEDLSVKNMKYLSIKQALADLAHFIDYKRETVPALANSKVIMAGGAYAGSLVVWFKKLYPELLTGGWASSAPLLAKVDFMEYREMVGQAYRELGSEQCYKRIQNGFAELKALVVDRRTAEVRAMLNLCDNFDPYNDLDVSLLFSGLSNIFSAIVQYQEDGFIPYYCGLMMTFDDDLTAVARFWLMFFTAQNACVDSTYNSTVSFYSDATYASGVSRPWYYQTCNELGWYQSSASRNQPFGNEFPASVYTSMCADIYGDHYSKKHINELIEATNVEFGGLNPDVENVYMSQGGLDPWNPMGDGVEEGASVIPLTSHCADLGSITGADSAEMRASKERLVKLVRQWLA